MENFLKQIQLSESAIKIYKMGIASHPLTIRELKTSVPELSPEEFNNCIKELQEMNLLVAITSPNQDALTHYLTLPPFGAIINYFSNIEENQNNINLQISKALTQSITELFKKNTLLELDSVVKANEDLKKDIDEDVIIQKQEVEDIVDGIENLTSIQKIIEDLYQKVKGITQSQFTNLIKTISETKEDILKRLDLLELKKNKKEVVQVLETAFKENLDKLVSEFTSSLQSQIEEEFANTLESIKNIMDSTLQLRDDFKMLLLNMISNFEVKMNRLFENVKAKNDNLPELLEEFEERFIQNVDGVVKDSIHSVTSLNTPISNLMKQYLLASTSQEKRILGDIWFVFSLKKLNEEIYNIIDNSQQELILILPNLEHHLALEQFQNKSDALKVKIASSEAHTNSNVKKFKEIKNLEFRSLRNISVIALKGDDSYVVLGVIQSGLEDPLKNFIGFGSNNAEFVKLFDSIFKSFWDIASSDSLTTPQSIGIETSQKKKGITLNDVKPITSLKIEVPSPINEVKEKKAPNIPPTVEVEAPPIEHREPKKTVGLDKDIQKFTKKIQEQVGFTPIEGTEGKKEKVMDDSSLQINTAFNILIQNLPTMTGEVFSKELQKVADLILEKKGFSVTLHKLRSFITKYKLQEFGLTEIERQEIIKSIAEWKNQLL